MTDIEKVDLSDASEKLRDKIKLAFAEVLTDAQWQALIESELKKFNEPKKVRNNYNEVIRTEPSELTKICTKIFEEEFKKRLQEYSQNEDFQKIIAQSVQKWLNENAHGLVESAIMSMLSVNLSGMMGAMTSNAIFTYDQQRQGRGY